MKKLIVGLMLSLSISVYSQVEYDLKKGVDLTATNYVTAALLNQLVDLGTVSATNKGIIIRRSGGSGAWWPNVTSNPRYTNFLWLDQNTSPAALKQYICCGNAFTNWVSSTVTPESITTSEIVNYTIQAIDMGTNSVDAYALVASSVSGNKIADNGILAGKLALASVIKDNYAFGSIVGGNITNNTITKTNIADGAITRDKLEANSVGHLQITNAGVMTQHLSNNTVTAATIVSGTITSNQIATAGINRLNVDTNISYNLPTVWGVVNAGTFAKGYGVSSITAAGTGQYIINFGTAMSDTNYCIIATPRATAAQTYQVSYFSNTTSLVWIRFENSGGGASTPEGFSFKINSF